MEHENDKCHVPIIAPKTVEWIMNPLLVLIVVVNFQHSAPMFQINSLK